jgi:hypothetical protein
VRLTDRESSWLGSLAIWLSMVLLISPLLLAWDLWDPLDTLPYLICFAFGSLITLSWYVFVRLTHSSFRSCLLLLFVVWAPVWMIGVGLGSNVLLDRSPRMRHETTFLGYAYPTKGPSHARFDSWRKPGTVETFTCTMLRGDHCFTMPKGQRVVVISGRGALGWEWIDDFATRE